MAIQSGQGEEALCMHFTKDADEHLVALQQRTQVDSRSTVVLNALRLFDHIVIAAADGAEINLGREGDDAWRSVDVFRPLHADEADIQDDEGVFRLSLDLTDEARQRLEWMRDKLRCQSVFEVVRRALAFYEHVVIRLAEGFKLYVIRGDDVLEVTEIPGIPEPVLN